MKQPQAVISLRRFYLESFIVVYGELTHRIDNDIEITKDELSSFLEELRDYASRADIGDSVIDELEGIQRMYCQQSF